MEDSGEKVYKEDVVNPDVSLRCVVFNQKSMKRPTRTDNIFRSETLCLTVLDTKCETKKKKKPWVT